MSESGHLLCSRALQHFVFCGLPAHTLRSFFHWVSGLVLTSFVLRLLYNIMYTFRVSAEGSGFPPFLPAGVLLVCREEPEAWEKVLLARVHRVLGSKSGGVAQLL